MTDTNQQAEIDELRLRLEEAEDTIRAIRSGAVDAFVVEVPRGARVYTLETADRPYRLLVEEMQQGALTLSEDGCIAYGNRRFAELVGRPPDRLMGTAFRDFIPRESQAAFALLLQQGRAGSSEGESHLHGADGALVPVFLTINSLPPDSGAAVGLLVTNLTTQLHHDRVKGLLAALEESGRRKNEFLAMLAHELRNPLAPIGNAVQLLRRCKPGDGEAIQSIAGMMERQIIQIVRLVDDLLDVSRVSRGKIELRLQRIELAATLNHVVEAADALVLHCQHDLQVTLPQQPVYVHADPVRLAQVIGNLVDNACKFTDKGGQIWLSVEVETQGKPMAVIRVRDSGVGITAEQMPRIFEMFVQLDTSLERSVGGLGIGLTLVKNLMELHGGSVAAHSGGAGQGSEFVLRLPMLADAPAEPSAEPTATETAVLTDHRILVADDNRDAAMSLATLLQLCGNQTHTAYDGLTAVEAAATWQPHVVLLDIGMPKLNGHEAARRIREQPWGKAMVLVALTGWGQEEDLRKSRESGFDGHLVKPVELAALVKLVTGLLPVLPVLPAPVGPAGSMRG